WQYAVSTHTRAGIRQTQRCAADQRREDITQYHIKRKSGELRESISRPNGKLSALPGEEMAQPFVPAKHSFRNSSGARSKKDICRSVRFALAGNFAQCLAGHAAQSQLNRDASR